MTDEKRQKVLLGVLGVLVLGAGSYWFVLRDSGPSAEDTGPSAPREKKKRERGTKTEKKKERRSRGTAEKKPQAERRQRTVTERKSGRKKRRTSGKSRVKKKKKELPPAAYAPPVEEWREELGLDEFRPRFV